MVGVVDPPLARLAAPGVPADVGGAGGRADPARLPVGRVRARRGVDACGREPPDATHAAAPPESTRRKARVAARTASASLPPPSGRDTRRRQGRVVAFGRTRTRERS